MLRVGEGYDLHGLVEGRRLRLACVDIPFSRGSLGHSDGDAAAHAVCDALLGALALGDMGAYFPSSESRWENADSSTFLREVAKLLGERGAAIVNVDITVVLEEPRLGPHIQAMREALATALGCGTEYVSVKAKSADGMGPVGRGEAVEARAVVLVDIHG
jgi:2-C-methyl-D-erythritol 2,4-cyclodiphosphate synthase